MTRRIRDDYVLKSFLLDCGRYFHVGCSQEYDGVITIITPWDIVNVDLMKLEVRKIHVDIPNESSFAFAYLIKMDEISNKNRNLDISITKEVYEYLMYLINETNAS